jgi:Flp pilus assembly pilin Flp
MPPAGGKSEVRHIKGKALTVFFRNAPIRLVRRVHVKNLFLRLKTLKDTRAQDLIEYALMAGFVAVAAGAVMPGVASSISTIFSKVGSVLAVASTQSS